MPASAYEVTSRTRGQACSGAARIASRYTARLSRASPRSSSSDLRTGTVALSVGGTAEGEWRGQALGQQGGGEAGQRRGKSGRWRVRGARPEVAEGVDVVGLQGDGPSVLAHCRVAPPASAPHRAVSGRGHRMGRVRGRVARPPPPPPPPPPPLHIPSTRPPTVPTAPPPTVHGAGAGTGSLAPPARRPYCWVAIGGTVKGGVGGRGGGGCGRGRTGPDGAGRGRGGAGRGGARDVSS